MKIAFVGTGMMGRAMASNLIKAGHSLTVDSRTQQKAEPLLAQGAQWAASPGEAAKLAKCVITMVSGFRRHGIRNDGKDPFSPA